MHTPSTLRTSARSLLATFASLDVPAPKPVADAAARLGVTTDAFNQLPPPGPNDVPMAVVAALDAGVAPADSPDVRRALAAYDLAGRATLGDSVGAVLRDQLQVAARDHADDIIGAWSVPFDAAAERIAKAHTVIGGLDLGDTDAIIRRGGKAAEAWGAARAATAIIDTVVAGWTSLHLFLTGNHHDKRHRVLLIADIDPETWIDQHLEGAKADPWKAVGDGHRLRLPTLAEVKTTVDAIADAKVRRDAAGDAARAASARRPPIEVHRIGRGSAA